MSRSREKRGGSQPDVVGLLRESEVERKARGGGRSSGFCASTLSAKTIIVMCLQGPDPIVRQKEANKPHYGPKPAREPG